MRRILTLAMIVGGIALMLASYFFLTAPWGVEGVRNSNPRLQFSPTLFIIGVLVAFSAPLVYMLLPERVTGERTTPGPAADGEPPAS